MAGCLARAAAMESRGVPRGELLKADRVTQRGDTLLIGDGTRYLSRQPYGIQDAF